mmetsp:Transcript_77325/g.199045  ORF Transcript_77325/g.199045 Transcript_77325/m.199045 type:complete len:201 (-) Transcript_77325:196-798(-)
MGRGGEGPSPFGSIGLQVILSRPARRSSTGATCTRMTRRRRRVTIRRSWPRCWRTRTLRCAEGLSRSCGRSWTEGGACKWMAGPPRASPTRRSSGPALTTTGRCDGMLHWHWASSRSPPAGTRIPSSPRLPTGCGTQGCLHRRRYALSRRSRASAHRRTRTPRRSATTSSTRTGGCAWLPSRRWATWAPSSTCTRLSSCA